MHDRQRRSRAAPGPNSLWTAGKRDYVVAALALPIVAFAVLILSTIQVVQPWHLRDCQSGGNGLVTSASPYAPGECDWPELQQRTRPVDASITSARRDLLLQESDSSNFRVWWRMQLPNDHSLLNRIRRGDAALDPTGFTNQALGLLIINNTAVVLQAPTIERSSNAHASTIVIPGSVHLYAQDKHVLIRGYFQYPTGVQIESRSNQIVKVEAEKLAVARQDATHFEGSGTGQFIAALTTGSPIGMNFDERPIFPLWSAVRDFLLSVVVAVPWLSFALLLQARACNRNLRRLLHTLQVVLLIHFAVSLANLLAGLSSYTSAFWRSKLGTELLQTITPWSDSGYPAVNGSVVLLFACAVVLMSRATGRRHGLAQRYEPIYLINRPLIAQVRSARRARLRMQHRNRGLMWFAVGSLWVAALFWYFDQAPSFDSTVIPGRTVVGVWLAAAFLIPTFLLFLLASLLNSLMQPEDRWSLHMVALVAVPLAILASMHSLGGELPALVRAGPVYVASAATLLGFGALLIGPLRTFSLRWMLPIVIAGVVVAIPTRDPNQPFSVISGWNLVLTLGLRIDGLTIAFVTIPVLVHALMLIGRRRIYSATDFRNLRIIGRGCVFVAVAGVLSFAQRPHALVIAVAALATLVLLPARNCDFATQWARIGSSMRAALVQREVKIGSIRRIWTEARKGLRTKVADGSIDYDAAQVKLRRIERAASIGLHRASSVDVRNRAFGLIAEKSPAEAGWWGAGWGFVLGSPWILLSLLAAGGRLPVYDEYPVLATIASIAPSVLQWPFWGFVVGFFFPILRGRTGLGKVV